MCLIIKKTRKNQINGKMLKILKTDLVKFFSQLRITCNNLSRLTICLARVKIGGKSEMNFNEKTPSSLVWIDKKNRRINSKVSEIPPLMA